MLERANGYFVGRFQALGGPCEVLMDVADEALALRLLDLARGEAERIERKFSRYRQDNIIHCVNTAAGRPVEVDEETANLLDYADRCHQLSEGRFDVTTGVLREVWRFDGGDRVPSAAAVARVLERVGWHKVQWRRPVIALRAGMELDLGGIGKEYAVDSTVQLIRRHADAAVLVNYGGDLAATGPRAGDNPWIVGVEDPAAPGRASVGEIRLGHGGVASSGDARRFLLKDGVRYGHILDPRTGWPVVGAPRTVTVVAGTCTEAGMLATFAMLHGPEAEAFLRQQNVAFWCL